MDSYLFGITLFGGVIPLLAAGIHRLVSGVAFIQMHVGQLEPGRIVGIHLSNELFDRLDPVPWIISPVAHDDRRGRPFIGDHAIGDVVRALALGCSRDDA
jgi:hypothetical protein